MIPFDFAILFVSYSFEADLLEYYIYCIYIYINIKKISINMESNDIKTSRKNGRKKQNSNEYKQRACDKKKHAKNEQDNDIIMQPKSTDPISPNRKQTYNNGSNNNKRASKSKSKQKQSNDSSSREKGTNIINVSQITGNKRTFAQIINNNIENIRNYAQFPNNKKPRIISHKKEITLQTDSNINNTDNSTNNYTNSNDSNSNDNTAQNAMEIDITLDQQEKAAIISKKRNYSTRNSSKKSSKQVKKIRNDKSIANGRRTASVDSPNAMITKNSPKNENNNKNKVQFCQQEIIISDTNPIAKRRRMITRSMAHSNIHSHSLESINFDVCNNNGANNYNTNSDNFYNDNNSINNNNDNNNNSNNNSNNDNIFMQNQQIGRNIAGCEDRVNDAPQTPTTEGLFRCQVWNLLFLFCFCFHFFLLHFFCYFGCKKAYANDYEFYLIYCVVCYCQM